MNYELAYRVGFHPWEDAAAHPPFTKRSRSCSTGRRADASRPTDRRSISAPAAESGESCWPSEAGRSRVSTCVEKALRRARDRVTNAGVDVRLVQGDVTALRAAGVGSGFRLVLDTGTFHGLTR